MTATEIAVDSPGPPTRWLSADRATVREVLMGAQDNLTNVLAVVLGVSIGSGRADLVALAGLSAAVAEAISMGGVLYTATRADVDMELDAASRRSRLAPWAAGMVTFAAALVGGVLPLVPFAVLPIGQALAASLVTSIIALFALGAWTTSVTGRTWWKDGLRLVVIAGAAALAAAVIGSILQVA